MGRRRKKPIPKSKVYQDWILTISALITAIAMLITPILNFILKLLDID